MRLHLHVPSSNRGSDKNCCVLIDFFFFFTSCTTSHTESKQPEENSKVTKIDPLTSRAQPLYSKCTKGHCANFQRTRCRSGEK